MSALVLKIIACAAMLIDHIGAAWGITEFRYIGRLAFPIFAFLLVNGFRHTRSTGKYMLRMAIFAVISEVPYDLLFSWKWVDFSRQNVFITLFLGLACIAMFDEAKKKSILLAMVPVAVCCAVAMALNCDYSYIGILTVMACHLFYGDDFKNRALLAAAMLLLSSWYAISFHAANFVLDTTGFDLHAHFYSKPFFFASPGYKQIFRVFALIPIFMYNGKKGAMPRSKVAAKAVQYGFYIFYPAHILIIFLVKYFLFR